MRDPRLSFPIALFFSCLFALAFEALFGALADKLKEWQTLVSAILGTSAALLAAYIAYRNLNQSRDLHAETRKRKHAAVRAVLPLALAHVSEYAERSTQALHSLLPQAGPNGLPRAAAPLNLVEPLPSETQKTLTDFIEYSDPPLDPRLVEETISIIQIHNSRLRGLVTRNHDQSPSIVHVIARANIQAHIIDAASIYAAAGAVLAYARPQRDPLPTSLTWDHIRRALRNMGILDDENRDLFDVINRRESKSRGPFERLSEGIGC